MNSQLYLSSSIILQLPIFFWHKFMLLIVKMFEKILFNFSNLFHNRCLTLQKTVSPLPLPVEWYLVVILNFWEVGVWKMHVYILTHCVTLHYAHTCMHTYVHVSCLWTGVLLEYCVFALAGLKWQACSNAKTNIIE